MNPFTRSSSKHEEDSNIVRLEVDPPAVLPKKGRVVISALGLAWSEVEPVIHTAIRHAELRKGYPIVVLSDVSPAWLVTAVVPVEILPTATALGVLSSEEWELWVTRRWEILKAKWDIRREIILGQTFEAFVGLEPSSQS